MEEIKQQFNKLLTKNKRIFVDKIVTAIERQSNKLPAEVEIKVETLANELALSILTNYQLYMQGKILTVEENITDDFILSLADKIQRIQAYYRQENQIQSFRQLLRCYWQEYRNLLKQMQEKDKLKQRLRLFIDHYFSQLEVSYFQLRIKNLSVENRNIVQNKPESNNHKLNEPKETGAAAKIEALYSVSQSLIESRNLTEVLKKIADVVAETLEMDRTYIFIVDVDQEQIIDMVSGGQHEVLRKTKAQAKDINFQELWEGLSGWVLRTGRTAYSPKNKTDARESLRVRKRRRDTETGDVIVVPLNYNGEMIGTLTGVNQWDKQSLNQKDVKLMTAMANHATVAIQNSRLLAWQREEKEKFATLFKTANDAILIHDLEGNILKVNQSACQQLGYSEAELLALNLQEIPGLDYKTRINRDFTELVAEGELVFETVHYNYKRGTSYFEVNSRLIEYEGDQAVISIARDITSRKLEEKRLKQQANRDALTGVYNRRAGNDFLEQQLVNCRELSKPLTICFVDIDNLKLINDNFGHPAGDEAIITIANIIKENIRGSDLICRVGGDEFLIIFPGCTTQQEAKVEQRILTGLEAINERQSIDYQLSISCGVVEYNGERVSAEELIKRADKRMYQKKHEKYS